MNKLCMEILIFFSTLLIMLTLLVVGCVLKYDLAKLKKDFKYKTQEELCNYINNDIIIRDKNCKSINFNSHTVICNGKKQIIIDLK